MYLYRPSYFIVVGCLYIYSPCCNRNHSFGSVILGAIANSAEPFRGLVTVAYLNDVLTTGAMEEEHACQCPRGGPITFAESFRVKRKNASLLKIHQLIIWDRIGA